MSNLREEIEQQRKILEQATAKIKEIESRISHDSDGVWKPANGEEIRFVTSWGEIDKYVISAHPADFERIGFGNYFKKAEQNIAETHAKQIRLFNQLKRIALTIDPEKGGRFLCDVPNYYLYCDTPCHKVNAGVVYHSDMPHLVYFSTQELAVKAYDMLDEQNKKTFRGDFI